MVHTTLRLTLLDLNIKTHAPKLYQGFQCVVTAFLLIALLAKFFQFEILKSINFDVAHVLHWIFISKMFLDKNLFYLYINNGITDFDLFIIFSKNLQN